MKKKFSIEKIKDNKYYIWDEFVQQNKTATLFHSTTWLSKIASTLEVIAVKNKDTIVGGIALIQTTKFSIKGYQIPPFCPYFGPVISDDLNLTQSDKQKIIMLILEHLPSKKIIDFLLTPGQHDLLPYVWSGFTTSVRYTYEMHYNSYEDWLAVINKNKKRDLENLLKILEQGEIIISSQTHNLDAFINLLKQTQNRKNFKVDITLLKKILLSEDLKNNWGTIIIEDNNGNQLAGVLYIEDNHKIYYLLNGTQNKQNIPKALKNANLVCMALMIKKCFDANKTFDFEGSILEGVEQFFRLLGGHQTPVLRVQKSRSLPHFLLRSIHQFKKERNYS